MGCGESKHAVATTEPIKKSTSRSRSRKIENPVQEDKTTKTITTTASSFTTVKNGDSKAIDEENKKNGENPVGVIPGEPFIYQKPPMDAANAVKKGAVLKEEKKRKLVVAVGHDRTASKESQASDYFSEDGIEEKSEYESPQPDEVAVVQEYKKIENKHEEGVTQREDDQVLVPKQEVQEEDGATMAAEDEGEQESTNETVVVAMEVKSTMAEAEITVERETKTIGTDEVKPTELEVRTIAEEKIKDADA